MDIKVYPGKLKGTVKVPPSKSMAHRAVICAALARGRSEIRGITYSDDMAATLGCVSALGADVRRVEGTDRVIITGINSREKREQARDFTSGKDGKNVPNTNIPRDGKNASDITIRKDEKAAQLDCIESGSTLRFMLPVAAALGANAAFSGRGKLPSRPMTPLADEMKKKGITFLPGGKDSLPFEIRGVLLPGKYEIAGNISSQYFSGLLFALPLLDGDSRIHAGGKLESAGYIDLTLRMMSDFGIFAKRTDYGFFVPGAQRYIPRDIDVEGDYSQAAFWLTAAACGSDITVTGLREDSAQGDRQAISILKKMGASVKMTDSSVKIGSPAAPERQQAAATGGQQADAPENQQNDASARQQAAAPEAQTQEKLRAVDTDGGDIPDIIPVLSVAAACAEGTSRFYNAQRLRIKECDRLSAMADCLERIGASVKETKDELIVTGSRLKGGCTVDGYNDHRIVMSMAIAALSCEEPIIITHAEAVKKSYPDFFDEFRRLGGRADVISDR